MCDEFPELIIHKDLKWIEAYQTENKLEYRIPSYKLGRLNRLAWELDKAEKLITKLKEETSNEEFWARLDSERAQ